MQTTYPRPLVLATGVFDLLHSQHVRLLDLARRQGAALIVGINSDTSAARIKPGRPIVPWPDRAEVLRALRCVDDVMVFVEDTPLELIRDLKPDILVKGHDYRDSVLPEAEALKEWGGRVWIAPTSDHISTSQIIAKIRALP